MNSTSQRPSEFHRYRISVIENWPEGPRKESALAGARAALERELRHERTLAPAALRSSPDRRAN